MIPCIVASNNLVRQKRQKGRKVPSPFWAAAPSRASLLNRMRGPDAEATPTPGPSAHSCPDEVGRRLKTALFPASSSPAALFKAQTCSLTASQYRCVTSPPDHLPLPAPCSRLRWCVLPRAANPPSAPQNPRHSLSHDGAREGPRRGEAAGERLRVMRSRPGTSGRWSSYELKFCSRSRCLWRRNRYAAATCR
jgi:hypothetical protein